MYDRARAAVLEPTSATHTQSTALTIDYLQVQAAAALVKMHDTRTVLPQYLSSQGGVLCAGNTVQGHADTLGCEASNDKFAESVFGTFDRMLKRSEGLSREAASGLAHAMHHNKSFYEGDAVARRKSRKPQEPPPPGIGFFTTLPVQEQRGLVEYCRLTQRSERVIDRQDNAEVAAYVKANKVKTNSEIELRNLLITEWGYGLSFFDRWQQRGVSTNAAMNAGIGGCDSAQANLDWLREQIEMRTRGLQWVEFKAKWSSSNDENIGTVDELAAHLRTIIEHERARRAAGELPSSAPAPILRRKSFKDLGTPTAQALALAEQRLEYSAEELRAPRPWLSARGLRRPAKSTLSVTCSLRCRPTSATSRAKSSICVGATTPWRTGSEFNNTFGAWARWWRWLMAARRSAARAASRRCLGVLCVFGGRRMWSMVSVTRPLCGRC